MAKYRPSCRNPKCERSRRPNQLMCPSCWSRVPKALQRAVYATWRPSAGFRQSEDYLAAVEAAIKAVSEEPGTEAIATEVPW